MTQAQRAPFTPPWTPAERVEDAMADLGKVRRDDVCHSAWVHIGRALEAWSEVKRADEPPTGYTRGQFAGAVDDAHAALHEADALLLGRVVPEGVTAAMRRTHEALHSVDSSPVWGAIREIASALRVPEDASLNDIIAAAWRCAPLTEDDARVVAARVAADYMTDPAQGWTNPALLRDLRFAVNAAVDAIFSASRAAIPPDVQPNAAVVRDPPPCDWCYGSGHTTEEHERTNEEMRASKDAAAAAPDVCKTCGVPAHERTWPEPDVCHFAPNEPTPTACSKTWTACTRFHWSDEPTDIRGCDTCVAVAKQIMLAACDHPRDFAPDDG